MSRWIVRQDAFCSSCTVDICPNNPSAACMIDKPSPFSRGKTLQPRIDRNIFPHTPAVAFNMELSFFHMSSRKIIPTIWQDPNQSGLPGAADGNATTKADDINAKTCEGRNLQTLNGGLKPQEFIEYMSVSENSVPLNPMVNDHYPY